MYTAPERLGKQSRCFSENFERCLVEKQELLKVLNELEVNYHELQLTTATMLKKHREKIIFLASNL